MASQDWLTPLVNNLERMLIVQPIPLSNIGWTGEILLRQLGDIGEEMRDGGYEGKTAVYSTR